MEYVQEILRNPDLFFRAWLWLVAIFVITVVASTLVLTSGIMDLVYVWLYKQAWYVGFTTRRRRFIVKKIGRVTAICRRDKFRAALRDKTARVGEKGKYVFVREMLLVYDGNMPADLPYGTAAYHFEVDHLLEGCMIEPEYPEPKTAFGRVLRSVANWFRIHYGNGVQQPELYVPGNFNEFQTLGKLCAFGVDFYGRYEAPPSSYARAYYVWGKAASYRFPAVNMFDDWWVMKVAKAFGRKS